MTLPAIVVDAGQRAEAAGFTLSSEPEVGALLSCLAASVPEGGRILELGTGVGSGWHGSSTVSAGAAMWSS